MLRYIFRSFECAMCGFISRCESKIDKHVGEFPNCAFTEQSHNYLDKTTLAQRSNGNA